MGTIFRRSPSTTGRHIIHDARSSRRLVKTFQCFASNERVLTAACTSVVTWALRATVSALEYAKWDPDIYDTLGYVCDHGSDAVRSDTEMLKSLISEHPVELADAILDHFNAPSRIDKMNDVFAMIRSTHTFTSASTQAVMAGKPYAIVPSYEFWRCHNSCTKSRFTFEGAKYRLDDEGVLWRLDDTSELVLLPLSEACVDDPQYHALLRCANCAKQCDATSASWCVCWRCYDSVYCSRQCCVDHEATHATACRATRDSGLAVVAGMRRGPGGRRVRMVSHANGWALPLDLGTVPSRRHFKTDLWHSLCSASSCTYASMPMLCSTLAREAPDEEIDDWVVRTSAPLTADPPPQPPEECRGHPGPSAKRRAKATRRRARQADQEQARVDADTLHELMDSVATVDADAGCDLVRPVVGATSPYSGRSWRSPACVVEPLVLHLG